MRGQTILQHQPIFPPPLLMLDLAHSNRKGQYMRKLILSGCFFLLSGCVTSSQSIQSWQGANVSALTQSWGAPDSLTHNPNGTSVYVYKRETYQNFSGPTMPQTGVNYDKNGRPVIVTSSPMNSFSNRSVALPCVAAFTANKSGTITDVKANGPCGGRLGANTSTH